MSNRPDKGMRGPRPQAVEWVGVVAGHAAAAASLMRPGLIASARRAGSGA